MVDMKHIITHENMAKLISVYYKGQENKDVKVNLHNGEDGYISVGVMEVINSNGIKRHNIRIINKDRFEKIVSDIYGLAGQQVTGIVNYGEVGTTVYDCGSTKIVTPELANHVVVTTKQKVLTR